MIRTETQKCLKKCKGAFVHISNSIATTHSLWKKKYMQQNMAWSETSKSNPIRRTTFVAFLYRRTQRGEGEFLLNFSKCHARIRNQARRSIYGSSQRGEKTRNHFYIWVFSRKDESGSTFGEKKSAFIWMEICSSSVIARTFYFLRCMCVHWIRRNVHKPSHQINSFCHGGGCMCDPRQKNND